MIGFVAAGLVVGVGLIMVSIPNALAKLGHLFLLLGLFALPWSAVQIYGVPLGDFPLVASIPLLVLAAFFHDRPVRVPGCIFLATVPLFASALGSVLWPPAHDYIDARLALTTSVSSGVPVRSVGDLSTFGKFELAILVLPIVLVLASTTDTEFPRKAILAWSAGITLSSLVAISDYVGITHLSQTVLGYNNISGRESGLTAQPNNIGVQAVMMLPIIIVAFTTRRARTRALAVVLLGISAYAVYLSGSRGSSVAAILVVPLTLFAVPGLVRWSGRTIFAGFGLGAVLLFTPFGDKILTFVRLTNTPASVQQSDAARSGLRLQAWQDFLHSPIHGIGWGYSDQAHLVYLQLLAAGGLLGLVGVAILVITILRRSWLQLRRADQPLAGALIASVIGWLFVGTVENQLTDQWIWVPLAALAAMLATSARSPSGNWNAAIDDPDHLNAGAPPAPMGVSVR